MPTTTLTAGSAAADARPARRMGTLAYMSPGAGSRRRNWTRARILFSFGLVLYEMATGTQTFPAKQLGR